MNEIWNSLAGLQRELKAAYKISKLKKQCENEFSQSDIHCNTKAGENDQQTDKQIKDNLALVAIEKVVQTVLHSVSQDVPPVLIHDSRRHWQNITFDADTGLQVLPSRKYTSVRFDSHASIRRFSLMLLMLDIINRLIQTNSYSTKRDIYYQHVTQFGSQRIVDDIVDSVSCMLAIPRWQLHVLATSKGLIAGDLSFSEADGNIVDCKCTNSGLLIPAHVTGLSNILTAAKFVLIVEKDATFQKLLDDGFQRQFDPCILITGKGFPDLNTRLLLRRLWEDFQLPMLALVDADPHGMEIMTVYKYGSRSMAFEAHYLTVQAVRWLGVLPSDVHKFNLPRTSLIPMSKADCSKAYDLMKRPHIKTNPLWMKELETLMALGKKAEIQSLDSISSSFLCDVYIPGKLRCSGWI